MTYDDKFSAYIFFFLASVLILAQSCFNPGGSSGSGDQMLFEVPEGFIGSIIVVYDTTGPHEGSTNIGPRFYQIPRSGILFTNDPPNPGGFFKGDLSFQVKESDGGLISIPWITAMAIESNNIPGNIFDTTLCAINFNYMSGSLFYGEESGEKYNLVNGYVMIGIDSLKNYRKYYQMNPRDLLD